MRSFFVGLKSVCVKIELLHVHVLYSEDVDMF